MLRKFAFHFGCAMAISASPLVAQEQQTPSEAPVEAASADKREALDQFDPAMVFELGLQEADMAATLDLIIGDLLTKGQAETGWSTSGIAMSEIMAGFREEHGSAFYLETEDGLSLSYDGEFEDLLGKGIEKHRLFLGNASGETQYGVYQFAPGIWMEMVTGVRRVDNAECSAGISTIDLATRKPLSDWTDEELGLTMLLYGMFKRIADADFCVVYETQADGTFAARAYDSEGHAYTALNKESENGRIVTREEALAAIAAVEPD